MSAVIERRATRSTDNNPYFSRVDSRPEIAPRVDPVVYDGLHGRESADQTSHQISPLSREQIAHYDQNGYLELDAVFRPDEVMALQTEALRLRHRRDGLDEQTLIIEPDGDELRSVFRIHAQSRLFSRLACDSRLAAIASYLLGDDVYIHQSRLNYKPGFFGKEFYWHSDFETWHTEDGMPRMRALSMSILLTENTTYNGPLMVIPGSHRRYVRCVGETPEDHYKQSLRRQEYGVPDPECLQRLFEAGGIVAPCGTPGKVVIFDCNIMHGSNSNISPLPRSNVFLVYNSIANRVVAPFGAAKPRPEFIATRNDIRPIEPVRGPLA